MYLKKHKLKLALLTAITTGLTSVAFADNRGDSLIVSPRDRIFNPGVVPDVSTSSVDVYFIKKDGAAQYMVDLVGSGVTPIAASAGACSQNPTDLTFELTEIIDAADLACDLETTQTIVADNPGLILDTNSPTVPGINVCKYTTPELANGLYGIQINPYAISAGVNTISPARNAANCSSTDSPLVHMTNSWDHATVSSDTSYQNFKITAIPPVAPDAIPLDPILITPEAGVSLAATGNTLTFSDPSPTNNAANWFQVWIYDAAGIRVSPLPGSNGTYNNWYKNTVDNDLACAPVGAVRVCTINLANSGPLHAGITTASANSIFQYWIKAENAIGQSDWSGPFTFKK